MPTPDAHLDVGDTLCGELALLLKAELSKLEPGRVLHVVARDSAAPADLPAWCELTGHSMVRFEHPDYWIRRKDS
jgi:tRNA 2-thiouridine synthesizing protein A